MAGSVGFEPTWRETVETADTAGDILLRFSLCARKNIKV